MPPSHSTSERLYFLDWIRILAFFLLILYHVGMYYVSWDWHVKSPHASAAIEPLMMLSSPWRLGLLFLISGVASAFLLRKLSTSAFLRQRSARLLAPLLFGMLVIVPPQPYFEVIEKVAYQGGYADFMRLYLSAYGGFCRDGCLILPTWNHLWFVAYLWVYTMLIGALALTLGPRFERLCSFAARALSGWKIVALPLIVLAGLRIALAARFPTSHNLVEDWHNHANSFTLFLLGALLAYRHEFWRSVEAMRFVTLGLALACWAVLLSFYAVAEQLPPYWRELCWMLHPVVYALCQWCAILAVCGFGRRHLQFDSAKRRYLTQAVFPVYILHQTLIVVLAHALKPAKLAPAIESLVLIVLTLTISFAMFEAVRRVPLVRNLFGIGSRPHDFLHAVAQETVYAVSTVTAVNQEVVHEKPAGHARAGATCTANAGAG